MGLGPRLALSYVAVVGLFLLVVLLAFPRQLGLSGPPIPLVKPPAPHLTSEGLLSEVAGQAARGFQEGGGPGMLEAVRKAGIPEGAGLTLFTPDQNRQEVRALPGVVVDPPPEQAWKGRTLTLLVDEVSLVSYAPVRAGGKTVGVLALALPLPPPAALDPFGRAMDGMIRSSILGAAVCLLVGLAFSTMLTRPLRRLAGVVRSFGPDHLESRAPVQGPAEMAELAASFNEMAGRLEQALETTRREKVRAEGLEASRREFLEDMSHNLGTPLAAVQGWVDMLLEPGLIEDPAEREQLLARARREILYVSRTVRQMLDLSRWEDAAPRLRMEDFPLVEPLMEVAENLEEAAGKAGTDLSFQGLDPTHKVRADRSRMRELFQIFLENCVEHGGEGCAVVVRLWPEGRRLQVEIADDGPGIPAERLPHLRERHHGSGGRGSGLGLAIAHRLVESHGGELLVENLPDRGTRIRFSLPLAPGPVRTSGSGLIDDPDVQRILEKRRKEREAQKQQESVS